MQHMDGATQRVCFSGSVHFKYFSAAVDKDFRPQSGSKHDEIFTAEPSICVLKWLGNTTICLLFRMNIAAENEPHPQYGHRSFRRFIPSFDAVEYCMSAWGLSPARLNPNMCNYFWNYRATKSTLVTFQISFNLPIGYPLHLPFPNLCHWKCTMEFCCSKTLGDCFIYFGGVK